MVHKPASRKNHQSQKNPRWQSYLLLTINAITWGAALIIVKPAFVSTTPFRFLWYRFMLAGVLSLPLLWKYRTYFKNWQTLIPRVVGAELIGVIIALSFLYIGLERVDAIHASLIATTTPLFVVLAGVLLLKEKLELSESLGTLLAFIGTLLLTVTPVWHLLGLAEGFSWLGTSLIIGQNIATALYFILAKRWYTKLPKLLVANLSFWVGALGFGLLSLAELNWSPSQLWAQSQLDLSQTSVLIATTYMAIFGSIIGLTAYIKGQDGIEASEASLFFYLQPVVYIPLGIVLLHEQVSMLQLVGLLAVLAGVYLAERRNKTEH